MNMSPYEELKLEVQMFFEILDRTEESDGGKMFHPTTISSCRVMDCEKLNKILLRMKELSSDSKFTSS